MRHFDLLATFLDDLTMILPDRATSHRKCL